MRLPKRNIWRLLFDIRPARFTARESKDDRMRYLDLRVTNWQLSITRQKEILSKSALRSNQIGRENADLVTKNRRFSFFRSRIFLMPLSRILVFMAVAITLAGVFWLGNKGISYFESHQANLAVAANEIIASGEDGFILMEEMRFEEASNRFRAVATALGKLRTEASPSFPHILFAAAILPENDFERTVALLENTEMAFSLAADLNSSLDQFIQSAPSTIFNGEGDPFLLIGAIRERLAKLDGVVTNLISRRGELAGVIVGDRINDLPEMRFAIGEAERSLGLLKKFLGEAGEFNVLILFQDPSQLRATGGLISSYGILQMNDGKVVRFSTYDLDSIETSRNAEGHRPILAPTPLRRIGSAWEIENTNWFFDFGLSAEKIAGFISPVVGLEFNLVAGVNFQMVNDLIGLLGPTKMLNSDEIATRNNAQNQPRDFMDSASAQLLGDLTAFESVSFSALGRVFSENFQRKDLMLWAPDKRLQSWIVEHGWSGTVPQISAGEDYLAVVISNIGGAHTDAVIRQDYDLETIINPSGVITNTLTIRRTHLGNKTRHPRWNTRNISYFRVLVPNGSVLLGSNGMNPQAQEPPVVFGDGYELDKDVVMTIGAAVRLDGTNVEIFEEAGKTVFGFWHLIRPGQTRAITLNWQLPFKANFAPPSYVLRFQKQSGSESLFSQNIIFPNGSTVLLAEPVASVAEGEPVKPSNSILFRHGAEMDADIRHAILYRL